MLASWRSRATTTAALLALIALAACSGGSETATDETTADTVAPATTVAE
ncbi:MAG: lipopolysaccharide biosynthesis protein, partial [Actinobacteria bacterium]|nr:lipopolysaccharide biosynthesis protein [Actinomycetota bacterium]